MNPRHDLQIRNDVLEMELKEERFALRTYKSERESLKLEYDKAIKDRNHWHDKAQEYKCTRDRLLQSNKERAKREALKKTLPRVITADELRDGQTAVMREGSAWDVGEVVPGEDGDPMPLLKVYDGTLRGYVHLVPELADTIVLLADAPDTKDINVAKETVKGEYPDNPWFATVYEDGTYLAATWRGTPVRPQSIRAGDLYDIHTAHGSVITGVVAVRNGVRNPQNGDMYRLVNRAT